MRNQTLAVRTALALIVTLVVLLVVLVGCVAPIAPAPTDGMEESVQGSADQATVELVSKPLGEATESANQESLPQAEDAQTPTYVFAEDPDNFCSSLIDLDLVHTSEALTSTTFWTWHLNFKTPNMEPPSLYAGCLRFYLRADTSQVFTASNLVVLTPCTVNGPNADSPLNTTIVPNAWTSTGDKQIEAVRATFNRHDYLECPLNLAEAGRSYFNAPDIWSDLTDIAARLGDDPAVLESKVRYDLTMMDAPTPVSLYKNLSTMAATGNIVFSTDDYNAQMEFGAPVPTHPLLHYAPGCSRGVESECPSPVAHAFIPISEVEGGVYQVSSSLSGATYTPDVTLPDCSISLLYCGIAANSQDANYSYMAFGPTERPYTNPDRCILKATNHVEPLPQYLAFGWFSMVRYADFFPAMRRCFDEIVPVITETVPSLLEGMSFWTGDATIYIGHDPTVQTLENGDITTGTFFEGEMLEVWLDPDNSGTKRSSGE